MASAPFYIYQRFTATEPIAKIELDKISEQQYQATLYSGDLCLGEDFIINGDQLQLDASFLKWKDWAVLLGFESKYKLDRLSGRYQDITEQKTKPLTSYAIAPEVLFDIFDNTRLEGQSGLIIDSQYGSSIYVDMNPDLTYIIYRGKDGLIAKSHPQVPATYVDGILTISITNACGGKPNPLKTLSEKLNTLALELLNR